MALRLTARRHIVVWQTRKPKEEPRIKRESVQEISNSTSDRRAAVTVAGTSDKQWQLRDKGKAVLRKREKVEARWKRREFYYPGCVRLATASGTVAARYMTRGRQVAAVHSDGTFDIDYDDGDFEAHVQRSFIRTLLDTHAHTSGI